MNLFDDIVIILNIFNNYFNIVIYPNIVNIFEFSYYIFSKWSFKYIYIFFYDLNLNLIILSNILKIECWPIILSSIVIPVNLTRYWLILNDSILGVTDDWVYDNLYLYSVSYSLFTHVIDLNVIYNDFCFKILLKWHILVKFYFTFIIDYLSSYSRVFMFSFYKDVSPCVIDDKMPGIWSTFARPYFISFDTGPPVFDQFFSMDNSYWFICNQIENDYFHIIKEKINVKPIYSAKYAKTFVETWDLSMDDLVGSAATRSADEAAEQKKYTYFYWRLARLAERRTITSGFTIIMDNQSNNTSVKTWNIFRRFGGNHSTTEYLYFCLFPETFIADFCVFFMVTLSYILFLYFIGLRVSLIHHNCQHLWMCFKSNKINDDFSWMFDKEEADILNDMILESNEFRFEVAFQGDVVKKKGKAKSEQTYEESFFVKYLVDIRDKRAELLKKIKKFAKNLNKLDNKKRKKMRKFLKHDFRELHSLSCDMITLMRLWDDNRKLEFKQVVDDAFLFNLDPTYIFDYKQYVFNPIYSNFFQLRVDEPSQFLLFLSYGVRRNPIINLISSKEYSIYPLDLSFQDVNHRFVLESSKLYNYMVWVDHFLFNSNGPNWLYNKDEGTSFFLNSKKDIKNFEFGQNLFCIESDCTIYDASAFYFVIMPWLFILYYLMQMLCIFF